MRQSLEEFIQSAVERAMPKKGYRHGGRTGIEKVAGAVWDRIKLDEDATRWAYERGLE